MDHSPSSLLLSEQQQQQQHNDDNDCIEIESPTVLTTGINNNNHDNNNTNDVENPPNHNGTSTLGVVTTTNQENSSTTNNGNSSRGRRMSKQRSSSYTHRNSSSNSNNNNNNNNSNSSSVKTPKDTLQAVYKAGIYKAALPLHLLCIQSFIAGTYIALAGHMFLQLNGGLLGAIFFPTGIIATVFTSAELFTGDALVFVASVLGNKVSVWSLLRNWTISWIFNFFGCLVWASVLGYSSGALDAQRDFAIAVAMKKVKASWIQIFIKAIGANFLVCLGVWQATCAEEAAGKILALWFPVSGFVIMGFDHVIANQFLIPMGMMFGADISISHLLLHALLPATLGNIVGGGICIGAVYWYVFDSMGNSIYLLSRIRWYPNTNHLDIVKEDEHSAPGTGSDASNKRD